MENGEQRVEIASSGASKGLTERPQAPGARQATDSSPSDPGLLSRLSSFVLWAPEPLVPPGAVEIGRLGLRGSRPIIHEPKEKAELVRSRTIP